MDFATRCQPPCTNRGTLASEWVETQLAHVDKNSIRGTYNHAQYLDGRRGMLQWYADHLEALGLVEKCQSSKSPATLGLYELAISGRRP